jgi:hypothetical protein
LVEGVATVGHKYLFDVAKPSTVFSRRQVWGNKGGKKPHAASAKLKLPTTPSQTSNMPVRAFPVRLAFARRIWWTVRVCIAAILLGRIRRIAAAARRCRERTWITAKPLRGIDRHGPWPGDFLAVIVIGDRTTTAAARKAARLVDRYVSTILIVSK